MVVRRIKVGGSSQKLDSAWMIKTRNRSMSDADSDSEQGTLEGVQLGYCAPHITVSEEEEIVLQDDEEASKTGCTANNVVAHISPDWSSWDGGKVGGQPSWLNPQHIPSIDQIQCSMCMKTGAATGEQQRPMHFVCQLYCPADDNTNNINAFHRTLYIFACPNNHLHNGRHDKAVRVNDPNCTEHSNDTGGVKVLRCQLPKENPYYPSTCRDCPPTYFDEWKKHFPRTWNVNTCAVCGIAANGRCPVQKKYFCGKAHQKEHMKYVHKKRIRSSEQEDKQQQKQQQEQQQSTMADSILLPSVFSEYELVVEEEPAEEEFVATNYPSESDQMKIMTDVQSKSIFGKDFNDESDANLEQKDLNSFIRGETVNGETGNKNEGVTDPVTIEFFSRIKIGGQETASQCLRYCRWPPEKITNQEEDDDAHSGAPLWIRSDCVPSRESNDIPPCSNCGGERAFEFQIMPQMLHYLLDKKNKNSDASDERCKSEQSKLNFGTIAVYTCINSCDSKTNEQSLGASSSSSVYMEEFAWRQPPLDD